MKQKRGKKVISTKKYINVAAITLAISLVTLAACKKDKQQDYSEYLNEEGIKIDSIYYPKERDIVLYDDYFKDDDYASYMDKDDTIYMKLGDSNTRKYDITSVKEKEYEAYEIILEPKDVKNFEMFELITEGKHEGKYINKVPVVKKTIVSKCYAHKKNHKFVSYVQAYEKNKSLTYTK